MASTRRGLYSSEAADTGGSDGMGNRFAASEASDGDNGGGGAMKSGAAGSTARGDGLAEADLQDASSTSPSAATSSAAQKPAPSAAVDRETRIADLFRCVL
jgi:hypothetical protein